jgi:hypothetical protein
VLNRREDIQNVIEALNDLTKSSSNIVLSTRFLFAFMMEMSNVELRNRLIYYMSETFAVPLIYRNQISFEQGKSMMRYVPEILFNMTEGYSVFSFGVGQKCNMQCGKSRVLNDLCFP